MKNIKKIILVVYMIFPINIFAYSYNGVDFKYDVQNSSCNDQGICNQVIDLYVSFYNIECGWELYLNEPLTIDLEGVDYSYENEGYFNVVENDDSIELYAPEEYESSIAYKLYKIGTLTVNFYEEAETFNIVFDYMKACEISNITPSYTEFTITNDITEESIEFIDGLVYRTISYNYNFYETTNTTYLESGSTSYITIENSDFESIVVTSTNDFDIEIPFDETNRDFKIINNDQINLTENETSSITIDLVYDPEIIETDEINISSTNDFEYYIEEVEIETEDAIDSSGNPQTGIESSIFPIVILSIMGIVIYIKIKNKDVFFRN